MTVMRLELPLSRKLRRAMQNRRHEKKMVKWISEKSGVKIAGIGKWKGRPNGRT